ncbi:MAG: hypothetical protein ACE5EY_04410 [Anaerolineae bacterium]
MMVGGRVRPCGLCPAIGSEPNRTTAVSHRKLAGRNNRPSKVW